MPEPFGEVVEQRLLGDGGLGHAEAAERAADRPVRVDGPGRRADGRDGVRAARMDGHAVGDGRAPRRVGAGVEVAVEVERGQRAVGVGSRSSP